MRAESRPVWGSAGAVWPAACFRAGGNLHRRGRCPVPHGLRPAAQFCLGAARLDGTGSALVELAVIVLHPPVRLRRGGLGPGLCRSLRHRPPYLVRRRAAELAADHIRRPARGLDRAGALGAVDRAGKLAAISYGQKHFWRPALARWFADRAVLEVAGRRTVHAPALPRHAAGGASAAGSAGSR